MLNPTTGGTTSDFTQTTFVTEENETTAMVCRTAIN